MNYNNIDDSVLKDSVDSFEYQKVSKGEYIFHEGETSKRFYGIIKGKVSIRKRRKILKKDKRQSIITETKQAAEESSTLQNILNSDLLKSKEFKSSILSKKESHNSINSNSPDSKKLSSLQILTN